MTSIKDVAKRAGVAISTVSKVLNNYPNVTEATRHKVNAAIEELHFVPNTIAAALSSKHAGRVAIIINVNRTRQAIDQVDMQILTGAMYRAKELQLDIITVFFTMLQDMSKSEIISYLHSQNITGILIFGLTKRDRMLHALIAEQCFKIVVMDAPLVNESTSCIWVDQKQAQYDVAKKTILENNSKRILYLSGQKDGYVAEERIVGMKQLAEALSLSLLVRNGAFSEKRARELTFQYAAGRDAIVCASDMMAIGAMRALVEMDIFRPVCGFDGITLMGYAGKQMNTVKQDFEHIAAQAIDELYRLRNGGEGKQIIIDHTLVRLKYLDIIC